MSILDYIKKLTSNQNLSAEESESIFKTIMNGDATPAQIAAILVSLKMKGESNQEIAGAAKVLRDKSEKLQAPENAMDTCGTGGDGLGTYNISTAVAFVLAGGGIPIVKHGNKGVSSRSGSSDVLRELGVNIDASKETMEKALQDAQICFMMAPKYHNAMRHVAQVRQELGIRTIFNILGPLANPAGAKYQLLGVYSKDLVSKMANVLSQLGSKRAWVVHGEDGLDEITTTGITHVAELKDGEVSNFTINPEDYGIKLVSSQDLKGGDARENAYELKEILLNRGKKPYLDIVLLNSAAAFVIHGKAKDLHEGLILAKQSINSLKANVALDSLVRISNNIYS